MWRRGPAIASVGDGFLDTLVGEAGVADGRDPDVEGPAQVLDGRVEPVRERGLELLVRVEPVRTHHHVGVAVEQTRQDRPPTEVDGLVAIEAGTDVDEATVLDAMSTVASSALPSKTRPPVKTVRPIDHLRRASWPNGAGRTGRRRGMASSRHATDR